MKNAYFLAVLKPRYKNKYAAQSRWENKLVGLEDEPIIQSGKGVIYRISPFWKAIQIADNKETPPFGFVELHDLEVPEKGKGYGTFENKKESINIQTKSEDCEIIANCCSFLFDK